MEIVKVPVYESVFIVWQCEIVVHIDVKIEELSCPEEYWPNRSINFSRNNSISGHGAGVQYTVHTDTDTENHQNLFWVFAKLAY